MLAQHEQVEIKIRKQQRHTFLKLAQILQQVNGFRKTLKNYDQSNEYLIKIQNYSEDILGKMQVFKQKMGGSYQELAEEQQRVVQSLDIMNKKIQLMNSQDQYFEQKQNKTNNRPQSSYKPYNNVKKQQPKKNNEIKQNYLDIIESKMKQKSKEVNQIQKQINSLGKHLGWPEEDHNDFIAIWNRCNTRNYFQIQQSLQGYFNFYTHQQIQQHMNKYMRLQKLNQAKKELIIVYKNLKQQKKMQELKLLNLQKNKQKQQQTKQQLKKKQEIQQKMMKQKLNEWKLIKQKQKKQQQQLRRKQQLQRKRIQQIRKKQKQQRNKQLLQQWKQIQQQRKQEEIKQVKSSRKNIVIDKQTQQRIKLREQMMIIKAKQLVIEKKRSEMQQRQKQQKIKDQKFIKYSHVNNKLQHKTTAVKQKARQKFDGKQKKQANTFGGQLLMTGVRATPSWMK